jgi:hypothetical protein
MAGKHTGKNIIRLLRDLQHHPDAQRQAALEKGLPPRLVELRRWQSERLRRTYADLLADPQYHLACEFFLTDLYSARDFSQRDYDAQRLHEILSAYLPEKMLRLLTETIALNRLSAHLDQKLADVLETEPELNAEAYARGYRVCDNYAERRRQIEMLANLLREAATGARGPVFAISLRLARTPAQRAGWLDLYEFLERGYTACKPMRNVDYFVNTIYSREMEILDRIFAGAANPFGKTY